jgi:dimeric dUTPase (all-alpha-NTP-PPase superfamily)
VAAVLGPKSLDGKRALALELWVLHSQSLQNAICGQWVAGLQFLLSFGLAALL